MWVMLADEDEAENIYIPRNAPSSTGEYDSLRSEISYYWLAVQKFLGSGDSSELYYFHTSHLKIEGRVYFFETDTRNLRRLGARGELDFTDIDSGEGEPLGDYEDDEDEEYEDEDGEESE